MAELINQTLRSFGLLHDSLSVILTNGPRQFIVIHGRSILPLSPNMSHPDAVFDLENAFTPVHPSNVRLVFAGMCEKLLQELPEVNVSSTATRP